MTIQEQELKRSVQVDIPINEIDDNHIFNCRGKITPHDVQFLIEDIAKRGLIQYPVVRPLVNGNFKYRVVAGFSRILALRVLRWKVISCMVRECTEEDASFLNLAENLTRKDLNFIQEAEAVRYIGCKYPNLTDEEIGQRLGQNRNWVKVRLFALNFPDEVKDVVAKGLMTYDQITYCFKLKTSNEQLIFARKIKEAKERGLRVKIASVKPVVLRPIDTKTRSEIFLMQDHIVASLRTHNFGTRCLAWAAGEISDFELFGDIANIAEAEDIPYFKPSKLFKTLLEEVRNE